MAAIPSPAWLAESLRLTAFPDAPIDPMALRVWRDELFGAPPAEIRRMPQEARAVEEGPALDGRLRAEIRTNRIDWGLSPAGSASWADQLPDRSGYEACMHGFGDRMREWLSTAVPPLCRLAFGAVLLLPAESVADANRRLAGLLPTVKIDAENVHDFLYRVNRRRESESGIPELQLNCLSTWSVIELVRIDIEAAGQPAAMHSSSSRFACRLEWDINSVPRSEGPFDKNLSLALFDELVSIGATIMTDGDRP